MDPNTRIKSEPKRSPNGCFETPSEQRLTTEKHLDKQAVIDGVQEWILEHREPAERRERREVGRLHAEPHRLGDRPASGTGRPDRKPANCCRSHGRECGELVEMISYQSRDIGC
jgi:hypothetical protein